MATLKEKIIELLKIEDGFNDREITDKILGHGKPQQSINIACRDMESRELIKRIKRGDGKIGNYLNNDIKQAENTNNPNNTIMSSQKINFNTGTQSNLTVPWISSISSNGITISLDFRKYNFGNVPLLFQEYNIENIFSHKNNKTLIETIQHYRYQKLKSKVMELYSDFIDQDLGVFLLKLKSNGDSFYLEFLNQHGDKKFCVFSINDKEYLDKKGLYAYLIQNEIKYIGRCRDSFKKRINQGYGKINPKNCFIDGQVTNCYLNSLINANRNDVRLYMCVLEDDKEIENIERELIKTYKPDWNIALK